MKRKMLLTSLGVALTLLISACSQPEALQAPDLEPQFGTPNSDLATHVSTAEKGFVYALHSEGQSPRDISDDGRCPTAGLSLKRFSTSGSLVWSRKLLLNCEASGYTFGYDLGLDTDSVGNAYALVGKESQITGTTELSLRKYSASGNLLWQRFIDTNGSTPDAALFVRGNGRSHIAFFVATESDPNVRLQKPRTYSANGQLLAERSLYLDISSFTTLAVADEALYILGQRDTKDVLAKYTAQGKLAWTRTFIKDFQSRDPESPLETTELELGVDGSGNAYVVRGHRILLTDPDTFTTTDRFNKITFYKYAANGTQVFQKTIKPFGQASAYDVALDSLGNAYISGWTDPEDDGGRDLLVRKYTTSGKVAWTYAPKIGGAGGDEEVLDVATRGSNEIYVVGTTNGKVNGVNNGRNDAFLIRLNGQGQKVWSR